MFSKLPRWITALSLVALAGGGAYASTAGQAGPYTVHFDMQPQTPVVGDNQAHLHIIDASGTAVTGAHVTVTPEMEGMAMAAQGAPAAEQGNGVYVAPVSLSMAGQWHVKVAVQSTVGRGDADFTVVTGSPVGAAGRSSLPWPIIGSAVGLVALVFGAVMLKRKPVGE